MLVPVAIGILLLYRLWVMDSGVLGMDPEEAYYFHWSQHPDLGYFSKPPMIAWLIGLFTSVLGDGLTAIKTVSWSLHLCTALIVVSIGRRLYDEQIGWLAGLMFLALPLIGALSLYTSTDAPLHFFWALSLRLFISALDRGGGWWLGVGLAAGLGLLSKYTMGVLFVGLTLVFFLSPNWRQHLGRPQLWLGVLLAFGLAGINLYWNVANDFIAFQHTADNAQLDQALFHPDKLGEFLAAQIVAFGPINAILLIGLLGRRSVWRDASHRLLLLASLPILGLISLQALATEANMNWASPAYIGLTLVLTAELWRCKRHWLWRSLALNLVLLALVYHLHALADCAGFELKRKQSPYHDRLGWTELGAQVREWTDKYPGVRLVSDSRVTLAMMHYHAGYSPTASWSPHGKVNSQYVLWGDVSRYPDEQRFLFLSKKPVPAETLARFERVTELGVKEVPLYVDFSRTLHGYLVEGFKGY